MKKTRTMAFLVMMALLTLMMPPMTVSVQATDLSADNKISSITMAGAAFVPSFDPDSTGMQNIYVPDTAAPGALYVTKSDSNATMKAYYGTTSQNATEVSGFTNSLWIVFESGVTQKYFTFKVTAQNGISRDYTINVILVSSTSANLLSTGTENCTFGSGGFSSTDTGTQNVEAITDNGAIC